jgi:hypothetical protein
MILLNFAKDFHHVSSGKTSVNDKLTKMAISFVITFIIKYILAQNKNDITYIFIDTLKFVIANFVSKLIVGLFFLDIIMPLIYGRDFVQNMTEHKFINNTIVNEIMITLSHVTLMGVFYVVSQLINSIGDPNRPLNLNNMSNVILQQLLTLRSLH